MPRPILEEPYAVWLRGIIKDPDYVSDHPDRVDDFILLDKIGPESWEGTGGVAYVFLVKGLGEWELHGYVLYPTYMACFEAVWPDDIFIVENQTYPGFGPYSGGEAWVMMEPIENIVADSVGAITGDKSFYEPMPEASPHDSYRYARQADGTRVYVRTEK